MLTARDISLVLYGTMRVARLERDGLQAFDATIRGFWRSYWAAAFLAPFFLGAAWIEAAQMAGAEESARFLLLRSIAYVMQWVAFPLLMVPVADLLQRGHCYFRYMVAYNWFQLVQSALVLLIAIVAPALIGDADALAFVSLVTLAAMLLYNGFIAKNALEVGGGTAAAIVIIDALLGELISAMAYNLV